jgi:hypothetical protein
MEQAREAIKSKKYNSFKNKILKLYKNK